MTHPDPQTEAWVLAGGASTRMGSCKATLTHGGRSLLQWSTLAAQALGYAVQVNDHDIQPGLGPLGGLQTVLETTPARRVLCLSCDMPLVDASHLINLLEMDPSGNMAVFTRTDHGDGFPFLFPVSQRASVNLLLAAGRRSLQALSAKVGGLGVTPSAVRVATNVNTPAEWEEVFPLLEANPLVRTHARG